MENLEYQIVRIRNKQMNAAVDMLVFFNTDYYNHFEVEFKSVRGRNKYTPEDLKDKLKDLYKQVINMTVDTIRNEDFNLLKIENKTRLVKDTIIKLVEKNKSSIINCLELY